MEEGEGGVGLVVETEERERRWPLSGRPDDGRCERCCDQPGTWIKLDKVARAQKVSGSGSDGV